METFSCLRLWPDRRHGPYRIEIHLGNIRGRIECVGLLIGHVPNWPKRRVGENLEPQPIQSSLLRQIPLPDLIEDCIETHRPTLADWATTDASTWPEGYEGTTEWAAAALASMEARGDRRGRKGHTPDHFVDVAAVYRDAYRLQSAPTQAVADHFSVSKSTAAKWVAKARNLGLLPQTTRGRPVA